MSRPYMLVSLVANKTTNSHSLFIYSFCLSVIRKIFNFCAAESNEEVTFHFEIPDLLPSEVRTTNTNCYWSTAHDVSHKCWCDGALTVLQKYNTLKQLKNKRGVKVL